MTIANNTLLKKCLTGFLAVFVLLMTFVSPLSVYASEGGGSTVDDGIAGSTVEIDSEGRITYSGDLATGADGSAWTRLISKYRYFIAGISGIGTVSMILFFIINFVKLGAQSTNPQERSRAIMGLVFTGLAAAGLGAVTFIVGIFFNAL